MIRFGRNSRSFETFYDRFHVAAAAAAVILAAASFFYRTRPMGLFPWIFLDAAALSAVQAAARLRRGSGGKRLSGVALALTAAALACLAALCGKVVWAAG